MDCYSVTRRIFWLFFIGVLPVWIGVWSLTFGQTRSLMDERRGQFISYIQKVKSGDERIRAAIGIVQDKKSDLRNIAIDYLVSVRAQAFAKPALVLLDDPIVQRGIIYYLRKVPAWDAVWPLIELLEKSGDKDPALQADIILAVNVISGERFSLPAYQSKKDREREISRIKEALTKKMKTVTPDENAPKEPPPVDKK